MPGHSITVLKQTLQKTAHAQRVPVKIKTCINFKEKLSGTVNCLIGECLKCKKLSLINIKLKICAVNTDCKKIFFIKTLGSWPKLGSVGNCYFSYGFSVRVSVTIMVFQLQLQLFFSIYSFSYSYGFSVTVTVICFIK
jgi:hypothetical protein